MPFHICGEEVRQFLFAVSPVLPFIALWWARWKGKL